MPKQKSLLTQEQFMRYLDTLYEKAIQGFDTQDTTGIGISAIKLALEYISRDPNPKTACEKLIINQKKKTFGSGFVTGLGGLITMPITLPADLTATLFVEIRMSAAIAYIGGYDLESDEVKTFVYATMIGSGLKEIVGKSSSLISSKITYQLIKKIPGQILRDINQKVGFRLFTKFGTKGAVNLAKAVPIIGGVVGGGVNMYFTHQVGKNALELFIHGSKDERAQ